MAGIQLLSIGTILTYILLSLWQAFHVFKQIRCPSWLYSLISLLPLTGHGYLLYTWIEMKGGQNLQLVNMLALTPWWMGVLIFAVSFFRPLVSLTLISYPLSCIGIVIALFYSGYHTEIIKTGNHLGMLLHILLSITAVSILLLAAIQSVLLWVQNYSVKHNPASSIHHLFPPIQSMEKFLFDILNVGLVVLFISLVSGFFYTNPALSMHLLPKTLLSVLAFIFIAVLLIGRRWAGWRGMLAVKWTLISVGLLLIAYFGTKGVIKI